MARHPSFARDLRAGLRLGLTTDQFYALPEDEQNRQIQELAAEEGKCPHCGNPLERCSDPSVTWYPQRAVCYASMERAEAQHSWEALHPIGSESVRGNAWHDGTFQKWSSKRSKRTPYHRDWGVTIFVADTDMGIGGDFLGRDSKP